MRKIATWYKLKIKKSDNKVSDKEWIKVKVKLTPQTPVRIKRSRLAENMDNKTKTLTMVSKKDDKVKVEIKSEKKSTDIKKTPKINKTKV